MIVSQVLNEAVELNRRIDGLFSTLGINPPALPVLSEPEKNTVPVISDKSYKIPVRNRNYEADGIGTFRIEEKDERIPVECSIDSLEDFLRRTKDYVAIESFFAGHPEIEILKRNFEKYIESLNKSLKSFIDQFQKGQYRESEISAQVSGIAVSTVEKYMLKIFRAVLTEIKKGSSEHKKLAELLTAYLERIGFFTYNNAYAGKRIEDKDYEYYKPNPVDVTDRQLDGKIKEIKALPYCMRYIDEYGSREWGHTEGQIYVFQYCGLK